MIRFGPSGNSPAFFDAGNKTSVQAPKWLASVGLFAYEYSFGRGYTMSEKTATELGNEGKINNVKISVHAPFYINFANPDEVMKEKSFGYITKGLDMLKCMQGEHLIFHIASQGKMTREEALNLTKNRLEELLQRLDFKDKYKGMYLCPETMGKTLQIGTWKEIIDLCAIDENLIPTFDFGHINALTQGGLKTKEQYKEIFDYCFEKLGEYRTKNCHVHFSKIEFGPKGEIKHLNYDDQVFGPNFEPFAETIKEYKLTPTIICESMTLMAEDALMMKKIFDKMC